MAESITSSSEDASYVNIHGNDVRVLICNKTGRILIPIDELKATGFSIYRKSQYNKLLVDDTQFTNEFNLFMLQCAQTYMLKNKIAFKENDILESINNCKKLLTSESLKETTNQHNSSSFLNNHNIRENTDEDFTVTKNFKQPTPMSVQNNSFNERKATSTSRRSSSSSSDTSRKFGLKENNNYVLRPPRTSFDQKNVESYRSQHFNHNQPTPPSRTNYKQEQETKFEVRRPPLHHNKAPTPREEPKPLNSITLDNPVHTVIVTAVEDKDKPPYIIWAQDVRNADTLIEIDGKIKQELENERVATKTEFFSIYLAQDEDSWFRCKVIKFKPLTVCFIDYGNCAQVNVTDLREISKDLADIPAQAVKIFLNDADKPSLYETLNIKIIMRKERGSYTAVINDEVEETETVEEILEDSNKPYLNKIAMQCTLNNSQKIMIIGEAGNKLAVRTRESFEKLKELEEAMKSIEFGPLPGEPQKNQIVVIRSEDKWKRAEILGIDGAKVALALLDYHEQIKVDVSQLRNITESLYTEPMTYMLTPPLTGYNLTNQKAADYVRELVKDKVKPVVVLEGGEFDLNVEGTLLSQRLASLNDRVMLKDLPKYTPKSGRGMYMLYACRDADNVTLVSQDEVEKYVDQILKTDLEDDDKPYSPIVGEVCMGIYQGSWSRCVVIRILNGRYEVKYIDFGNVEFLKPDQLKKLTPDATSAPVLGVLCKFIGLPPANNIDELIKNAVVDGECYNLVVKRFDGSSYEIEAPDLYQKIRESN